MITEHQEVARYRVAEQLRAAEARAQRHARIGDDSKTRTSGPRHGLATALRRLADRLQPASPRPPRAAPPGAGLPGPDRAGHPSPAPRPPPRHRPLNRPMNATPTARL